MSNFNPLRSSLFRSLSVRLALMLLLLPIGVTLLRPLTGVAGSANLVPSRLARMLPAPSLPTTHPDYRALQTLVEKYGCPVSVQGFPTRPITRPEFATMLQSCQTQIKTQLATGVLPVLPLAEQQLLQRLQQSFAAELAAFRDQVDALEEQETKVDLDRSRSTSVNQPSIPAGKPALGRLSSNESTGGTIAPPPASENGFNTESYNRIEENAFRRVAADPLSTFSIDVDTASYSNVRRFITQGTLPPKDAVRIEELINYFSYTYPQPEADRPFSITTEVGAAPWNSKHKLVLIGLQGKRADYTTLPASNLVFLIDVSGSMDEPNKLPLVKQSLKLLVNELRPQDRVSLVVYAGNVGLVLPPTPGNQKDKIRAAIDRLEAGGPTAGAQGIELAYKTAQENFLKNGNNRVILATDGDFNIGVSSDAELTRLIEQKRDQGIFLTVLGFGTGNYKDSKMEQLADQGNGNYAYIDTLLEGKKVLVNDIRGTLFTIAKDVKIQVEFNPAKVQGYRLIGYENRLLQNQDFNNDKKDAGDIGSGHSVTALYEIIPAGIESDVKIPEVDPLRYQKPDAVTADPNSPELMQVKLRYKLPDESTSQLITQAIQDSDVRSRQPSANLKFAAAVATFGMVLRNSEYKGSASLDLALNLAKQAKGDDREGYRDAFIRLVEQSRSLLARR
ncbi:hypothetical protein BST81_12525 [Leptolyngbya sp. 'hensonii']|uniref:vWA domain-containing protein n=1 Tax=Leptolyngbya sp. 'hensonii' TaxID=1922337 RepID=UPI0009502259|nr:VWA domain-containing protein [Leptolyngbya sp. 'hensonii']OLP17878.1 hypothetical protein BST81_12525 [Leptolyngbya sp. 'hensonii']